MSDNSQSSKVKKCSGTVLTAKFLALLMKLTRFWLLKLTD